MNSSNEDQWVPTQADITWTRQFLAAGEDQFTWTVPMSLTVIRIDKIKKTFSMVPFLPERNKEMDETNNRITFILEQHLGYTRVK